MSLGKPVRDPPSLYPFVAFGVDFEQHSDADPGAVCHSCALRLGNALRHPGAFRHPDPCPLGKPHTFSLGDSHAHGDTDAWWKSDLPHRRSVF